MDSLAEPMSASCGAVAGKSSVGTGRAHGKVILLGEHAVVYGAPALAVPVPGLRVTASADGSSAERDTISFVLPPVADVVAVNQAEGGLPGLIARLRDRFGVPGTMWVDVRVACSIPLGRGLGASAAYARAVVLAVADLFGRRLDAEEVFELVQAAESVVHGRASGVDAHAVGSSVPILFSGGAVERLRIGFDGVVVIADSGVAGRTRDAVELLRGRFAREPLYQARFVDMVESETWASMGDLADGRAKEFGARLTTAHGLLREAGLSTDQIDDLVEVALRAGALGAKITGGGLGGCLIAVTDNAGTASTVARRLEEAGAVKTWRAPLRRVCRCWQLTRA
ncbi:mevalonate kinase [Amycolatopsis alba]|uniref:mevalonate kinase n=1 Tax=Amycolatopsis alba TaxID=76020 RepID=UPI003CC83F0A